MKRQLEIEDRAAIHALQGAAVHLLVIMQKESPSVADAEAYSIIAKKREEVSRGH